MKKKFVWNVLLCAAAMGASVTNAQEEKRVTGKMELVVFTKDAWAPNEMSDFIDLRLTVTYNEPEPSWYLSSAEKAGRKQSARIKNVEWVGFSKYTTKISTEAMNEMGIIAYCNDADIYESEWIELYDVDENLRKSTWGKFQIRFKLF